MVPGNSGGVILRRGYAEMKRDITAPKIVATAFIRQPEFPMYAVMDVV